MTASADNLSVFDRLRALLKAGAKAVHVTSDGETTTAVPREPVVLPGSFNPIHDGHWQLAAVASKLLKRKVAFELSIANVEKPPLEWTELCRRLRQFHGRASVWITHAPRFVEKSELFPGAMFVVGADTAERILQARFYGDADGLDQALASLYKRRCRFLVGGRVNSRDEFVHVDDLDIPAEFRKLFLGIPREQFRIDVSSTALRESLSGR